MQNMHARIDGSGTKTEYFGIEQSVPVPVLLMTRRHIPFDYSITGWMDGSMVGWI